MRDEITTLKYMISAKQEAERDGLFKLDIDGSSWLKLIPSDEYDDNISIYFEKTVDPHVKPTELTFLNIEEMNHTRAGIDIGLRMAARYMKEAGFFDER